MRLLKANINIHLPHTKHGINNVQQNSPYTPTHCRFSFAIHINL